MVTDHVRVALGHDPVLLGRHVPAVARIVTIPSDLGRNVADAEPSVCAAPRTSPRRLWSLDCGMLQASRTLPCSFTVTS